MTTHIPEILAPAGDRASFLAALAAGADAVYAGLKHFSARMQAENFSLAELARLTDLAHARKARVYIAMNTLLKPGDARAAGNLLERLGREVRPDALIFQDLGLAALARQTGFAGELHLSTLANFTSAGSLKAAQALGAHRVVLPRELDVDEIKSVAAACPEGLSLETFVHGALCYCVSGRCYWSSWLGGKSGLRGRCVQPCRRLYRQGGRKGKPMRLFSCQDLSLDVLTRALLAVPQVAAWKIEGRKKGPHYVFYATTAYRMLRDQADDPQARKSALDMLDQSLSRTRTHSVFLPQRPHTPIRPEEETASGMLAGKVKREPDGRAYFTTFMPLLSGDFLRIGYEDDSWHQTIKIRRGLPKRGRVDFRFERSKTPPSGASVFLLDRREPELVRLLNALDREEEALAKTRGRTTAPEASGTNSQHSNATDEADMRGRFVPVLPEPCARKEKRVDMHVTRFTPRSLGAQATGLWMWTATVKETPARTAAKVWWWLPPVVWPKEEEAFLKHLAQVLALGGRRFVCNAPWQRACLEDPELTVWAGPFCNVANALAVQELKALGFHGAFVSPELPGPDLLALPGQSPLPLGVVVKGLWPLGMTRYFSPETRTEEPILSPRNEVLWTRKFGQNMWLFPNWEMDLSAHQRDLADAGYSAFAILHEVWPKAVPRAERPGQFNWENQLL